MEQKYQDEFRVDLHKQYLKRGWECLANYRFVGEKYAKLNDAMEDLEKKIEEQEKEIAAIQAQPDFHTVQNKEKVKALRETIRNGKEAIKQNQPTLKKLFEEAAGWREKGLTDMDVAESMLTFSLKTKEEMAVEKKAAEDKANAAAATPAPETQAPAPTA